MENKSGKKAKKILLVGNPNAGKSAVFSRLTGADVISSNYPGSTVELKMGRAVFCGENYEIIDVPGIYSLEPGSKAEEVAVKIIKEADVIVNVIESTNLERNLNLTISLIAVKKPMVAVLNFWDETKHTGIEIDPKKIEEKLGIPAIPFCAITGEGVTSLCEAVASAKISRFKFPESARWKVIGDTVEYAPNRKPLKKRTRS